MLFFKVFKLPKSRWPAMKDKTVNIPIFEKDIIHTLETLPRTPNSAGIIPVKFKRKLKYKNAHMIQYVSVPKIMQAIKTLKILGHKYHQFLVETNDFAKKCQKEDLEGFNFLFPDDEIDFEEIQTNHEFKDHSLSTNMSTNILNDELYSEKIDNEIDTDQVEAEEEEYESKDSVKKWQFRYNRSTCFSNNYPEINYQDESLSHVSVAPGAGKTPSNILREKDWDIKSFP